MIVLLILLLLVLVVGLGATKKGESDSEQTMRVALRLHEIRRKLDVADLKHRQRQDALRLKRSIADALRNGK